MTLPFENDTSKVIKKMSYASVKANKAKNIFLVITMAMITFLIFSLLCTGFSYKKNFDTMEVYMQGTMADGCIENTTSDYSDRLKNMEFISDVGEQIFLGLAKSPNTNDFNLAVNYYDEVEWDAHILPTISGFAGNYPVASNEIALSQNVLEQLGISDVAIGMEIPLSIDVGQAENQTFILSGYFTDYVSTSLRPLGTYSGNIIAAGIYCSEQSNSVPVGNVVVSKEFAKTVQPKESLLTFNISASNNMTYEEAAKKINEELELSDNQGALVFHSGSVEGSSFAGLGIALLVIFIVMFCGYLCIYNIVQIAIVKDTQMFGQFKTIGMTPRQIKLFIKRQNSLLCIIGIPLGLVIGIFCSQTVIPYFINTFISGSGYKDLMPNEISLHPLIFIITALFVIFTVFISCSKPAKNAGKISPISAMNFSYAHTATKNYAYTTKGNPARMAYRNIFREKKKARVVFLSLSTGITLLICVLTVLSAPDWNKFLNMQTPNDFFFTDTSIEKVASSEDAQFNQDFVQQIRDIPGVTDVEVTYALEVNFDETDRQKIWKPFIEDKALVDKADYESIAESAYATAVTLSRERLETFSPYGEEEYSEQDLSDFESGKSVYLLCTEKVNYPPEAVGQTVTLYNKYTNEEAVFHIAGFLKYPDTVNAIESGNENPESWGMIRMSANNFKYSVTSIYMSEAGMLRLADMPIIQEIRIQADPQQEPAVKQQLMNLRNGISQRHLISRSDMLPLYQPFLQMMKTIGVAFSCILFLIGLLNFINTIGTSIYSRQNEIAALEGVGMSKRQMKKMLMFEGLYYCLFTVVLVGTLGMLITYGVIQALKDNLFYFSFNPPVLTFAVVLMILLSICTLIPLAFYHQISNKPLAERLKTN